MRTELWSIAVAIADRAGGGELQAQTSGKPLGVGSEVPPLSCSATDGTPLSWQIWRDRAVLVFFHAQEMPYSTRGLQEVVEAIGTNRKLHDRAALLLVTNGRGDLEALEGAIEKSGLPGKIVVDPDRKAFQPYRLIAFPTVFSIDRDRRVTYIAKGFGPLLKSRVVAAAELSAGLIDRESFEQSLAARVDEPSSEQALRLARTVRMAKQLLAAGMLDEARESLLKVLDPQTDDGEGVSLLAAILLRQARVEDAARWIDRLAKISPKSNELRKLRAELALAAGDYRAAARQLDGLDASEVRVAWLKGRALELEGRFEEAAKVYRTALEGILETGR